MADRSAIEAGRAFVRLVVEDGDLRKGLLRAQGFMESWGKTMTATGMKVFAVGSAMMAPLLASAKIFASTGTDLLRMSERTGIAVDQLSRLTYAARQSGLDTDAFEGVVKKLNQTMGKAQSGTAEAIKPIRELGLSVAELSKLTPDEQMLQLADRLDLVQDRAHRAYLAMELFGSKGQGAGGTAALPMFEGGGAAIRKSMAEADALGMTVTYKSALAAEQFTKTLDTLYEVAKRLAFTIGQPIAESLLSLIKSLSQSIGQASVWIEKHGYLVKMALAASAAVMALGAAWVTLSAPTRMAIAVSRVAALSLAGLYSALTNLSGAFAAIASTALGFASMIGRTIFSAVGLAVGSIYSLISTVGTLAISMAGDAISSIGTFLSVLGSVASAAGRVAVAMAPVIAGIADLAGSAIYAAVVISDIGIALAASLATSLLTTAPLIVAIGTIGLVAASVAAVFAVIYESIATVVDGIVSFVTSIKDAVTSTLSGILTGAVETMASAAGWITRGVGTIFSAFDALRGNVGHVFVQVKNTGEDAFHSLASTAIAKTREAGTIIPQIWGQVSRVLAVQFDTMKTTALASFDGIKNALTANDWSLAAQILWKTLQLAWEVGVSDLIGVWAQIKPSVLAIWRDTISGMEELFAIGKESLIETWHELTNTIITLWAKTVRYISDSWALLAHGIGTVWEDIIHRVSGLLLHFFGLTQQQIDDAEKSEDSQHASKQAALDAKAADSLADNALAENKGLAGAAKLKSDDAAALKESRAALDNTLNKLAQENIDGKGKPDPAMAEKQKQIADTIAEIKRQLDAMFKTAAKDAKADDDKKQKKNKPGGIPDEIKDRAEGTFQTRALFGLAQHDDAAERLVNVAGRIENIMKNWGRAGMQLAFG